jgi:glutamate carboxypeptidase
MSLMSKMPMNAAIIAAVDTFLAYAQRRSGAITELIRRMVECESPSDDAAAVDRFTDLLAEEARARGAAVKTVPGGSFGRHLLCEFSFPGKTRGRVLVLGHADTVWPLGTLRSMPYREAEGRLWGPGVLDMKAGLAFFLFAMSALRELETRAPHKIFLQVNSEEEVGSPTSRALTEKMAAQSKAVLVLEPGTGLTGKLKTARKGVGHYIVSVKGRAAHAGVDFEAGASAVLELSRQIARIAAFTDLRRGVTVNAGVIAGGTRSNVVAAEAHAEVDIRVVKLRDAGPLDRKFRRLRPLDRRCAIAVSGGLNRPPMERSAGTVRLFRLAQRMAGELGLELEESLTGGGSDGNFTAALGVPTLDGLGAVGEGAHAASESILIDRIPDRVALLAKLLADV